MARILLLVLALAIFPAAAQHELPYDLVLRNARIVDGTGNPWFRGDIAIKGDTIARIAPSIPAVARRSIDLHDAIVAPGFIDVHTHAGYLIFRVPTADNFIRQGVTTVVVGVDGGFDFVDNAVPLKPFLDRVERLPKSINVASVIGQGNIREAVVGLEDRKATPEELDRMRELVRQDMKDGAWGLSTGLFYVPGTYTPTEEVIELQKVVAPYRGVHMSHMRDETANVVESVKETIAIGEQGGVPTHVSHHKTVGKASWGKSVETLRLVDEARARGVDVTLDLYPYTATVNNLQRALLPKWAQEGGPKAMQVRLRDPTQRARARREVADAIRDARGGGDPANIGINECQSDATLTGRNVAQITRAKGLEPTFENAAETVLALIDAGDCGATFNAAGLEDLERILVHPATMIAADSGIRDFGKGTPHPRGYGTFARVLAVYVREKRLLTLEEAVRKMSGLPAARMGFLDRGLLRAGMKADITVFDPARVRDLATYEKPHQYAEGFGLVIVNGEVVYENGVATSARPGRLLYGPGYERAPK
jgi:N-acyl-D-amino-acid deacylase